MDDDKSLRLMDSHILVIHSFYFLAFIKILYLAGLALLFLVLLSARA